MSTKIPKDAEPDSAALRVLCITSHRGSITDVRPEAGWFIGLSRKGVQITVMTEADTVYAERMRDAGVNLIDLEISRRFDWAAMRSIRQTLIEGQQQIVHMFNNRAITNGILASTGLPVRLVTYRGQTGNISRLNPGCWLTHLNPRVRRITCVADAVRRSLIESGVSPDKPVTIYKGHDLDWYQGIAPLPLSEFGVPADAFTVACVANNRPRKGVPVLIQAARYLPQDTRLHFLLIGNGMDSEEIRAQIAGGPLADRFHLLGYRDDVLNVIATCDGSVLPSIKREGLPKTVIESMALGIPPVVTRTGGCPELVEDGVSGLVVNTGDPHALAHALSRLATDQPAATRMGINARQRIADVFNVEQGVTKHLDLYRELTADMAQPV